MSGQSPTGRVVMRGPNMQQIAKHTPEAAAIRAAFLEEIQNPMKIEQVSQLTGFTVKSMVRHKRHPSFVEITFVKPPSSGKAGAPMKIVITIDADEFFDLDGNRIACDIPY